MKRLFSSGLVLAMAVMALAFATSLKMFETTYHVKGDSALGKAKCASCHGSKMGGKSLNPYGQDMQSAMRAAGAKAITAEVLRKIESQDSDGDGMKNGDELRAGRLPGAKN